MACPESEREGTGATALAEETRKRDTAETDFAEIENTLARAAEKLGDITPLVYARLFADMPHTQALFARDTTGAARAAMLSLAIEMVQDLAGPHRFAASFIAAERSQHEEMGVPPQDYLAFFSVLCNALRDGLGADWPADADAAWARVIDRAACALSTVSA